MARSAAHKSKARPRPGSFMAAFEQHQGTAVDSLLRLLTEPVASMLTWLVIGIAIALPLCLILFLHNLQQAGSGLEENSTLSVYMQPDQEQALLEEAVARLSAHTDIRAVELITPEQALAEFEQASGFSDVLQGLEENPLPAVLLVTPALADAAGVSALQRYLQEQPGVDRVQIDLQWLQRLNAIVAFAGRMAILLALLLGLGVVLAIGNTVRMAIENRRAEIVVVKLVGGTDAYVARPFLYTGFWYGMGGGLAAVLIILLAMFALQGAVADLLGAYNSDFAVRGLDISGSFAVLISGAALGWAGAWVSVMRHLRAIEPR